ISAGFFAGDGTSSTAVVTDKASVLAKIGSTAQISIPGQTVSLSATAHNNALADTAGGAGGGISISVMVPTAQVSGGATAPSDGPLPSAPQLDVDATSHDTATTTLHALSIGFLGGVTTSESDSVIDGTTGAYLGSSATIESAGTNVT